MTTTTKIWPPLSADDVPETRIDGKWHIGCMVTQRRAIEVATQLFPHEFANGADCRNEQGRQGQSCRICADRNENWIARVRSVRAALMKAFS